MTAILLVFQGKITAQGKLLLHGPLICTEGKSATNLKGKELQVFLFEQTIIFSEAVGKKTQFTSPVYIHKADIQVSSLFIDVFQFFSVPELIKNVFLFKTS